MYEAKITDQIYPTEAGLMTCKFDILLDGVKVSESEMTRAPEDIKFSIGAFIDSLVVPTEDFTTQKVTAKDYQEAVAARANPIDTEIVEPEPIDDIGVK